MFSMMGNCSLKDKEPKLSDETMLSPGHVPRHGKDSMGQSGESDELREL